MEYKQKVIDYLEGNDLIFRDSNIKVQCQCINPEHIDTSPSAFFSFESDEPFYHCSSCNYHLDTEGLIKFLGVGIDEIELHMSKLSRLIKEIKGSELTQEVKQKETKVFLPPKKDNFTKSYRGISPQTYKKAEAYFTQEGQYYQKRIIFPIYDYKNKIRTFEAISTNKEIVPKVLRPKVDTDTFFGFENLISEDSFAKGVLFINEGLYSALSFIELGYNSVFNFGTGDIQDKLNALYNKNISHIVLCGDYDKVGFTFNGNKIKQLRKSFKVTFLKHPYGSKEKSDANDYLKLGILQDIIDKTLKGFYFEE